MPSTLGPRQNQERKLSQLTASQHGLVTGEQAMNLGLSRAAIRHRLWTERWIQVFPNVYRMANAPETESQYWAAAVLWAGPDAAVSHRSALKLWGYSVDSDFIEVVTTQRRAPVEGTRVHLVRNLPKEHVTFHAGLVVTTPERTLLDIALMDLELVERALDELERRGWLTYESVLKFLASPLTRWLPGRRVLKKLLQDILAEEPLPRKPGERIQQFLKSEGLEAAEENVEVERGFRVTLGFPRWKVTILSRAEAQRQKPFLEERGWECVVLDDADIDRDPELCAYLVTVAIAKAGGDIRPPKRRWPVKRHWLRKVDAMRIREGVQHWREVTLKGWPKPNWYAWSYHYIHAIHFGPEEVMEMNSDS
jgi:hypothetical protein